MDHILNKKIDSELKIIRSVSKYTSFVITSYLSRDFLTPDKIELSLYLLKDLIKQKKINYLPDEQKKLESFSVLLEIILLYFKKKRLTEKKIEEIVFFVLYRSYLFYQKDYFEKLIGVYRILIFDIFSLLTAEIDHLKFSKDSIPSLPSKELASILNSSLRKLKKNEIFCVKYAVSFFIKKIFEEKLESFKDEHEYKKKIKNLFILELITKELINKISHNSSFKIFIKFFIEKKKDLDPEEIIPIIFEEFGGIYIKMGQILGDLLPSHLRKKMSHFQSKIGGIHNEPETEFHYIKNILKDENNAPILDDIIIPEDQLDIFGGASIGAIYEFKVKSKRNHLPEGIDTVLIKFKRPKIKETFNNQFIHFNSIIDKIIKEIKSRETSDEIINKLLTIKKNTIQVSKQFLEELDFFQEKRNADLIRVKLQDNPRIHVPIHFYSSTNFIIMEKCEGVKINELDLVNHQDKKMISQEIWHFFLVLFVKNGIIWSDPHPGNLIYNLKTKKISIIDLNPIFHIGEEERNFIIMLMFSLFSSNHKNTNLYINKILKRRDSLKEALTTHLLEEISILPPEKKISTLLGKLLVLDLEFIDIIQPTLKAFIQVSITVSSISNEGNFFKCFKNIIGIYELLKLVNKNGVLVSTHSFIKFKFFKSNLKNHPEIGPVIDERDIQLLAEKFKRLRENSICDIEIKRINPDKSFYFSTNTSQLSIQHSSRIIFEKPKKSSHLKYMILLPDKNWLIENNEFIRVKNLTEHLCLIEILENVRRGTSKHFSHLAHIFALPLSELNKEDFSLYMSFKIRAHLKLLNKSSEIFSLDQYFLKLIILLELISLRCEKKTTEDIFLISSFFRFQLFITNYFLLKSKYFYKRLRSMNYFTPVSPEKLTDVMTKSLIRN